ncbi:MAG TPA: CHASE domain-containing protein, partial [Candidatus Omnitrophota bacterium]|nr:CHASE domain-containing protein [Candidatus Omnitrophota bacterium]
MAVLVTMLGMAGLLVVEQWEWARVRQEARLDTLNRLSTLRARLEGELNGTLLLTRALSAIIAVRQDVTREEFDAIAREMMAHKRHIRNVTLAQGTVIRFVYPPEGNEAAVGIDFRDLPQQWPAVERMFRTRQPILAGPVTLVQGGTAIIGRTPVFTTPPGGAPGSGPPWGAVAIPITLPSLLDEAGLTASDMKLSIAIRGRDGLGAAGEVFHGDPAVFERDPVRLEVTLPGGQWVLAALPKGGWDQVRSVTILQLRTLGGGLSLLAGVLVFFWVRHADSRRDARRRVAASENRLSAMLAGAPFPLVVLRQADGAVLYANLRAGTMVGLAPQALIGRPLPPRTFAPRDL